MLSSGLARAQSAKPFVIGYLNPVAGGDANVRFLRRQFLLGLRDLGYLENRHFTMEDRHADGQLERLPALAAELVNLPVDVIVTSGEAAIRAAKSGTQKIPIVMALAPDPVGSGIVASLAHPGGNITGMSGLAADMASKRVELLKEMVPAASHAAVLWNSSSRPKIKEWQGTQAAARSIGLSLRSVEVRTAADFNQAFSSILRERPDALLTFVDALTLAVIEKIGRFALDNRLPMFSELREFAVVGAIATYGTSRADLWRRSAIFVDKIVRGAKPADLPIEQPTRFELIINLKAAKAIGFPVAPTMLTRADDVIE